jgi:glycosyltransferase involved in cell wall biosynthesis
MTEPGVRLSVVIPAYNEGSYLDASLTSLRQQDFSGSYEVIVLDNNSRDDTAAIASAHGARVHEPRRGMCVARERGTRAARGEIVVSTDADTVHPADWLTRLDAQFSTMTARSPWLAPAATPIPRGGPRSFPDCGSCGVTLQYHAGSRLLPDGDQSCVRPVEVSRVRHNAHPRRRRTGFAPTAADARQDHLGSRQPSIHLVTTDESGPSTHARGVVRLSLRRLLPRQPADLENRARCSPDHQRPRRRGGPMPQAALARGCRDGNGHDCGPGSSRFRALT